MMSKGMKMIKFEGEIDYDVQRECSSDCINLNLVDNGLRPSCFTNFEYEDIKELQTYFDTFKNIDIYIITIIESIDLLFLQSIEI